MFDAILSLILGIVLVLFLASFIAGSNMAVLTATDIMILGFTPTIALILLIYGAVKAMRGAKSTI